MHTRTLIIAAGVSALLVGTACELIVNHNLSFDPADAATGDDGGPIGDAAPPTEAGPPRCPYATEPDATPPGDDGDAGIGNITVLAIRTLSIGTPTGVDLDGLCTCQFNGNTNSCVLPSNAPNGGACDADGGVDDRTADLYVQFPGGLAQRLVSQGNQFAACGQRAILFGITDYNGLRNDSHVKLVAVTSVGLFDAPDGGADAGTVDAGSCTSHVGDPQHYTPQWNGHDAWSVVPGDMVSGVPAAIPINGIVKDYVLIADARAVGQPASLNLSVNLFGATAVRINSPIIVAKVRPIYADGGVIPLDNAGDPVGPGSGFILDGTASGRASADDLLRGAALADFDTMGTVICTVAFFDLYKPQICGYRDISFDPADDFKAGKACDGFSTSFQFVAYPALIGNDHTPDTPLPNPCRPDQLTCASLDGGDGG